MKKLIVLVMLFSGMYIFSKGYNDFEKFEPKYATGLNSELSYIYLDPNKKTTDDIQLFVGNYLVFTPSKYAQISAGEFLSDTIGKTFSYYSVNKKGVSSLEGKITYDPNGFIYNNIKNPENEKIEIKKLGMVFAEIDKFSDTTYRIRSFMSTEFATNSTFYIKKISDTELSWSSDKPENEKFFFTLENKKLIVKNKKGETRLEMYKEGDSLIMYGNVWGNNKMEKMEIKVNKETKKIEYINDGKVIKFYNYVEDK